MANPTVVFTDPGTVVLKERERPTPGEDEVLIETDTTLVSTGTELTVLSGEFPEGSVWADYGSYPFTAGYSNVGTVRERGPEADVEVGTRVATWSPHAAWVTAPAEECVPVPEAVSNDEAALFAIGQIVANGVRRGRIDWGECVAVFGLGILGQLAVRFAHLAGAEHVVGVDLADDRIGFLPDRPGVHGVNPEERDPADAIEESAGRPADVAMEVTGNPDAIPGEFDVLREQGRLVLLSSPHGETTLDFHDRVNVPSVEIIGAHELSHPPVATPQTPWTKARNAELFFAFLQQGRLDVEPLFTHAVDAADAPDLYRELLADRSQAMAVRLEWN